MADKSVQKIQHEQFELERDWAARILASSAQERSALLTRAYTEVNALMDRYKQYSASLADKAIGQRNRLLLITNGNRGKFLDIGCARGDLLVQMQQQGWQSFGVDVAKASVLEARRQLQLLGVANAEHRVVHGEVADLSEGGFNLIFHSDVLEHIHPDDVQPFLQACFEKTAALGHMVIITPNALVGPSDISRDFVPPGAPAQGLHLKEYNLLELNQLLQDAGYKTIKGYLFQPNSRFAFDRLPRPIYHRVKLILETLCKWIPARHRPRLLKRLFATMDFACVIAQKGSP